MKIFYMMPVFYESGFCIVCRQLDACGIMNVKIASAVKTPGDCCDFCAQSCAAAGIGLQEKDRVRGELSVIKNYANKVMDYEYNAFMSLMHVSVSKHLFDEHFTVLWANDYFYELIGYPKKEYEALYHNHVDAYYKEDPASLGHMAKIVLEAYRRKEPGYEFECPMHVKGGGTAWIRVTGRFTDEVFEGVPVIYAIYTDITKFKELQAALERQARELSAALETAERANRAKSDFLSRMSHDIRTPMNAIVGMTDIAAARVEEPDKVRDCLRKIALSSRHLLGLINDVLDMSKIESGTMALNKENMSLPGVLENVVAIMQPILSEKKQDFSVRLHRVRHEDFVCDSLRLRQICINILSNAAKFTPEGGRIVFEVEEDAAEKPGVSLLRFVFADSGQGIDPAFLPQLFDAFTRERDSRVDKIEGSGLGLAITKKLVDLFGGSIRVESQMGEGTAFYVELPLEVVASPAWQDSFEGVKILVADNDAVVCEYLAQTLEELGASVCCAGSGAEAVEAVHLDRKGFDMALLDWKMPDMDGLETARALRRQAGAQLPILIASAYDWSEIEDEARRCGVDGFLQKPLFQSALRWAIQNFVFHREAPRGEKKRQSFVEKRFLLVEDNEINSEIAVELLSDMGATVETAKDGAQGLARFAASAAGYYDMILMDIQMPKMNGYEATRRIRALPRKDAAAIPIVALTADAFAEDVAAAREAGMNGHMAKPLDAAFLNRELGKYL